MTDPTLTRDEAALAVDRELLAPPESEAAPHDAASAPVVGYAPEPPEIDAAGVEADVTGLVEALAGFRLATDHQHVEALLDTAEAEFREAASVKGVSVVPEAASREYRARVERDLVLAKQAEARALLKRMNDLDVFLRAAIEASQTLASEVGRAKPAERLQARVVDLLGTQDARARLGTMTAAEALDAYRHTSDGESPEFLRLVEREVATGWRGVPLREASGRPDVRALTDLKAAVRDRRAARVPPALTAAAARLRATQDSAVLATLLQLAARGEWRRGGRA